ncbi:MAG: glycoside hydrolase family 3 N-terminal domain-containing protein [Clostridiales bacterium]|nr:glycoside hydrolase family 3 protein [Roseburia sp.]MDD7635785.1 glycoside hydrolase family 3 N-terminal domain-containing protein [Clostridiales bacterium]MDY4112116.1 glycoside hydrolase family 3 N-terminal domain-containing protein [Roseburia sp.]
MNREERRERRQKDTKNATVIFIIFMLVVTLLVAGVAFAVSKFVLTDTPTDEEGQTESQTEDALLTGEVEAPVVPVIDEATTRAAEFIAGMTLEDKVAQMFVVTPDALTGFSGVTAAGDTTKDWYNKRPVGGIVYMSGNLKDHEQTATMLTNMQTIATERIGLPAFLCVDEEGGSAARIAGNSAFGVTDVGAMSDIGATGDSQNAYNAGTVIGGYLSELGFNVDFAPVADVLTNGENNAIGDRSFGADSQLVAEMVTSELKGLSDAGIYGTVKHFPGHGAVSGDSHEGMVTTGRTLEELMAAELIPFQSAINADVCFVMAGHIAAPSVTGDNTPASLSKVMITDILRTQMGYNGIVITDAMNIGAITENYGADEAAVMAVQAGADMILMPEDYETAYNGLLDAVKNGTISEERINESLIRIVKVKQQMQ